MSDMVPEVLNAALDSLFTPKEPGDVYKRQVKGMIPSNTIGAKARTRLHCYQGAEHAHAAQKPEKIEF